MSSLIVISAPSGAGKTTLCQRLLADYAGKMRLSISATTRSPRGNEKDGEDYFFISKEEFERMKNAAEFAEHAFVHGNHYGTPRSMIDSAFKAGQSVLLDIDVQGAESLRRAYPGRCLSVFVAPPSLEVLEQRLRIRGTDTEESIRRRMQNAKVEMVQSARFDYVINNDSLDRAYNELQAIVAKWFSTEGHV